MVGQGKGAAFEREICVKLSEWVTAGQRKDVFWRTAMSGGRATVFKKKGSLFRQSGDICAVAPEGNALTEEFYFELKFYKSLDFPAFFVKGKGVLGQFWEKTRNEARSYGLRPVLIVKQNRMPILWVSRRDHLPQRWMGNTRIFRVDVVHMGCSIFRFRDIVSSDYAAAGNKFPTERIRL